MSNGDTDTSTNAHTTLRMKLQPGAEGSLDTGSQGAAKPGEIPRYRRMSWGSDHMLDLD